jgi:hypothetical protein
MANLMMHTMHILPDQKDQKEIVVDEHAVQKVRKSGAKASGKCLCIFVLCFVVNMHLCQTATLKQFEFWA